MSISWIHLLILVAILAVGVMLLAGGVALYIYLARKDKENKE